MALIGALLAVSLSAEPARLILGKDGSATLTIDAPASAKITLSASVGSVSEAKREGSVFHARYTPPKATAPSVALLLAQVDDDGSRDLAWLALPLWGADTMVIETRPGSTVEANIAGIGVGPVTADASGTAKLPMVVPPGVSAARLHITDKLGNATDKPLDLDPPPFSRVRAASREPAAAPGEPIELEIFAVRPDGTPDDAAKLDATGGLGRIDVRRRLGPGLYLALYTPLYANGAKSARVDTKINGQAFTFDVPVVPGAGRSSRWWPSSLGTQRPWSASVGAFGGGGSSYDGAGTGTFLLEGALRLKRLPLEGLVDLGASFFERVTGGGTQSVKPWTQVLQAGLRFGLQVVPGLDGHATVFGGVQHQSVTITPPSGPSSSADGWTARYGIAVGANLGAGPGRLMAQVQFDGAGAGVAGVAGSLGGLQVLAGYLVTVY